MDQSPQLVANKIWPFRVPNQLTEMLSRPVIMSERAKINGSQYILPFILIPRVLAFFFIRRCIVQLGTEIIHYPFQPRQAI